MHGDLLHTTPPASLAHFTRPELIIPRLRSTDLAGIIDELSCRLRDSSVIGDGLSFYHDVLNREFMSSSTLPAGIAIPHARCAQVRRLRVAIGRTAQPVVWGIRGSRLVEHIFLIAIPATDASNYLSLLSGISAFGRQPVMQERLRAATDSASIFELLKAMDLRSCFEQNRSRTPTQQLQTQL